MDIIEQLNSFTFLRIHSVLTSLTLILSLSLSLVGVLGNVLIQGIASVAIVLGTILELSQVLIVIQLANRNDKIGWVLHRFAYLTLVVMMFSFLSIVGSTFLSSFFIFAGDVMIIAVMAYVMQTSFGICLSLISFHSLKIGDSWQK